MRNIQIKLLFAFLSISSVMYACIGNTNSNSKENQIINQDSKNDKLVVKNIDQQAFIELQKDTNTLIIDVRTPSEIAEGYIKGATIFADVNNSNFEELINKLDKNKTYLVYCRSGARSSKASSLMIDSGFNNIYNLTGGIMGWNGDIVK